MGEVFTRIIQLRGSPPEYSARKVEASALDVD
jgi:hypothetical protein